MDFLDLGFKIPLYRAFRRFGVTTLPANMTFSVIDRCNMACRTCGIWKHRDTDELRLEEYEKIVEPLDLFWITISGGEPFMREDIGELVTLLANRTNASYVTIATNGMLDEETKNTMKFILENTEDAQFMINFSIDGPQGHHEYMRRTKDAFQRVSSTVEKLREIDSKRLNIGSNTVISKYNEDKIPETYRDVMEIIEPDSYIAEVAEEREKLYNEDMDFAPENPEKALQYLLEQLKNKESEGPANLVRLMRKGFYRHLLDETEITNYTGFISAQCNPTGEIWPTSGKKEVMGDLRQSNYDFRQLWESEQADRVRDNIRENNPQDMLANSFYNNMLANPHVLLKLLLKS